MSLLIELKNVTKTYSTGACYFNALKEINFRLHKSEMLAIIGASGSGKSTLMNILGFLDHCTTGEYIFSEHNVSHLNDDELSNIRNRKIGFIFQAFYLLPRLNALQNVMLPLFYRGETHKTMVAKSMSMLKSVGMEKFFSHKPNQLSGGQQQRVAIARTLIGDPELILADEPTGALDSKTGEEVMQLLINLNETQKCSIVVITHDHKVSHLCKRVVNIQDGCVVS